MTTITIAGGSYHVLAGVTLSFTNENAFFMDAGLTDPSLTIDGVVNVTMTSVPPGSFSVVEGIQIGASVFYANPVIIGANGALNVASTVPGVEVFGYNSGSWSPPFTNNGAVHVSAVGDAVGLRTYDVKPFPFTNHGVFDVTSSAGQARGVDLANGGVFHNSGDIEVAGHTSALAVDTSAHTESFDNTGTIHALSDTAGAAVAVSWGFGVSNGGWSNEGLIKGDVALTASLYSISPTATITYVNTGTMIGAVQLTSNNEVLANSGTITGAITTGAGADTLSNTGTITGQIDLGDGADQFNGQAGAAAGDILGGAGDDTLRGGSGTDTLDGGAGSDLLIGGSGAQSLVGGDGADTINAVYNNTQVEGGAGDDVIELSGQFVTSPLHLTRLDGGDGNDSFTVYAFPGQALTIDGGTGHNTLEMHYFGQDSAPIVLHLNGDASGGAWLGVGLQNVSVVGHIANVVGSDGDDVIKAPGTINGGAGDDSLTGSDSQTANLPFNLMALTGDDTISGGSGGDSLSGLGGDDLVIGGAGADTLSGGAGADIFQYNLPGESTAVDALHGHLERIDHITDWSSADFLQITSGVVAGSATYQEISAADYDTAYSRAQSDFSAHGVEYTVAQVGSDVIVFAAHEGYAIDLVGRNLADISAQNLGPAVPAPVVVAPPPNFGDGGGSSGGGGGGGGGGGLAGLIPTTTPSANNDYIVVTAGQTEIHAGAGADTLQGSTFDDYLRGDDGDDSLQGGSAFDDINGNKGSDTVDGGAGGADWLVGGQGDDSITAHHSANLIYGNLGNDTLHSGDGADVLRGGQGDDSIVGGVGNDFISGDRGNDTESGGAGADIFHGSQDAGIDRVLDFSQADGDRVELDSGTTYTLSQVGADTIIDTGAGNEMILVGVQLSSLKDGWIFTG